MLDRAQDARVVVLCALSSALLAGCAVKSEPIDGPEQPADNTGGSENASGGQDGMGGTGSGGATIGGTTFLEEGEVLLGSCMAPVGNGCRDFLTNSDGFTTEDAYQRCAESYTGGFSEELWSEGEHCPVEIAFRTYVRTAVGACKIGPHEGTSFAEVTYIYSSSLTEEEEVGVLQEYCEGQFYSF